MGYLFSFIFFFAGIFLLNYAFNRLHIHAGKSCDFVCSKCKFKCSGVKCYEESLKAAVSSDQKTDGSEEG